MAMNLFETAIMTLINEDGTTVQANLSCQLDTVNLPWNAEVGGMIPTDWYDLYSLGWTSPVPARGQYFVDQATSERYQVFSTVFSGVGTLQMRVTRYPGGA